MKVNDSDLQYQETLGTLVDDGSQIRTRNSNCKRLVAVTHKFTASPLVCVRKTAWKNALREWEWFMNGSNFIEDLHPSVQHWWRPWAEENGEIHFNYSRQFRSFSGDCGNVDSVEVLIEGIRLHPFSRRNVITTWNTSDMNNPSCRITNCHGTVIQAFVGASGGLSLVTYQRSADFVCGVPHNWIQYWAFLLWLAHRTDRKPKMLTWIGGDVHLYEQHYELADKILCTEANLSPPNLVYTPTSEEFIADDFTLDGPYNPVVTDRAEMVV